MGKYCYVIIYGDGRTWYGDDAVKTKRINVPGLPEAVKITRKDGAVTAYSLGPKSRFYVIPNAMRMNAGLSLGNWVKNCEIEFAQTDDSVTIGQIVVGLM